MPTVIETTAEFLKRHARPGLDPVPIGPATVLCSNGATIESSLFGDHRIEPPRDPRQRLRLVARYNDVRAKAAAEAFQTHQQYLMNRGVAGSDADIETLEALRDESRRWAFRAKTYAQLVEEDEDPAIRGLEAAKAKKAAEWEAFKGRVLSVKR
jgi:hypothetical protein